MKNKAVVGSYCYECKNEKMKNNKKKKMKKKKKDNEEEKKKVKDGLKKEVMKM
jgi:hypothetical protein